MSASPPPGVNWAIKAGDTGGDHGNAISALPDGSSIVTGYFEGTATFGGTTLTSASGSGMFTAKANVDGTWAWAATADGASVSAGGVSTLPDGSAVVAGHFWGTATFGSTTLISDGATDVFTAKMNADGSWAWATKGGGTETDIGTTISALPDGSSIVTGTFFETAVFGNTRLTSSNWSQDVFTAKMNADGTWAWATKAGGADQDYGQSVSSLADGSSVVTGTFSGTTAFGSIILGGSTCGSAPTTYSCSSVFIAKMNADGTWAWATKAGGVWDDIGYEISALPNGSYVLTGSFSDTAVFGSTTLTSAGGTCFGMPSEVPCTDVFVARYVYVPQAPAAPTAVAGDASASVTLTPLAVGSATSYTVTSSPGEKTCTVLAPLASCIFQGLTNGTSYRFAATATNGAGTGPASEWSVAVTPAATAAAASVVIKGRVRCVAITCVTTGSVPAGATRITQRATSRPAGHSAAGTCTVRRVRSKRTYSCTMRLSRGAWVITTTARTQSSAMAHFSKRVQVAPRKAAVTG